MVQITEYPPASPESASGGRWRAGRTAEQGTAEYRSEKYYLTALQTSAVSAGGGFDILRFKAAAQT
jgi:hypothetical protein